MTPWAFENGEAFELGEAQCPTCGYPAIGYFQNGSLMRVELSVDDPCLTEERSRQAALDDRALGQYYGGPNMQGDTNEEP